MRKELLEQVLFVFGSILTCALVLGATHLQAEILKHPLLAQMNADNSQTAPAVASPAVTSDEASAAQAKVEFCLDPAISESALKPSLQNCWHQQPATETALARLDLSRILTSQFATPLDESSLRTELPVDIPVANQSTEEQSDPDLLLQLCESDITESDAPVVALSNSTKDEAFTMAATRLLCEAVGTSDELKNPVRPTFVAAARLPF